MRFLLYLIFSATILIISVDVADSTVLKPAALFILTAGLIALWVDRQLKRQSLHIDDSAFRRAFFCYLAISAISITQSLNIRLSWTSWLQLGCFFIITIASESMVRETADAKKSAGLLLAVTAAACIAAWIVPAVSGNFSWTLTSPPASTFGNSTYFAGYLILVLPLALAGILNASRTKWRIWLSILVLVMVFLLLKTESRSAWFGALAGVLVFVLLAIRRARARWLILGGIALGAVLVWVLFPDLIHRRLGALLDPDPTSSIHRRLYFYAGAWQAFLHSPVIGNGVGNFIVFLPRFRSPDYWIHRSEDIVPHAHNELLETLSETGLAGFLCILVVIVLFARQILRALRNTLEPGERTLLIGLVSGLIAAAADSIASINLRTIPVAVTFSMMVGISLGVAGEERSTRIVNFGRGWRMLRPVPYAVLVLLLVWYLPNVAGRFSAERDFLKGNILRYRGQQATPQFEAVLAKDSSYADAQLYLAADLMSEGRDAEARSHIRRLLSDYPFYPKAKFVSAMCRFNLGDTSGALRDIEEELKIETTPPTVRNAAMIASRLQRLEMEYSLVLLLCHNAILSNTPDYVDEAVRRLAELDPRLGSSHEHSGQVIDSLQAVFKSNPAITSAIADYHIRMMR